MLGTITSFEVERNEFIPTHNVLRMVLTRNPLQLKRTFLQQLGSLKGAFEARIAELVKQMEAKEAAQKRKDGLEAMQEEMGNNFIQTKEALAEALKNKDTESHWRLWCRLVEEPYVKSLGLEEKEAKQMKW